MSWVRAAVLLIGLLLTSSAVATETALVAQVSDGDTIVLKDGRKVRYLGINAPERGQPFYQKARELNLALTAGKTVRLEFDREREDRYGRLLAYVYVGQEMVNARLLREGLAHLYLIPPNLMHVQEFLRLQEEAKAKGAGLWASFRGPLKITALKAGPGEEYVRIANVSAHSQNLGGYKLSDRAGHTYTFPAVMLPPGYVLTLFSGAGRDTRGLRESALVLHWHSGRHIWNNSGDTAFLRGPDGREIDRYDFRPARRGFRRPR